MFHSARLKLTGWYLLIIMAVSVAFSLVIYRMLLTEVMRFERLQRFRIERRIWGDELIPIPFPPGVDMELVEETRRRILAMLVVVDFGILILSGGLAYFLAGRTLLPIQTMMDEQNRFIGDASHELRTPLTALKSSLEVFLRNKKRTLAEAETLVTESVTDVNRLQKLAESLLQLAAVERSNERRNFEKINVDGIVEAGMRNISPLAAQKKMKMETFGPPVTIEGDKTGLTDVVTIILDNAVKYSKRGGKIEITTQRTDGWASVSIRDEGIGINEKDLPHIFDRFYRADTARSSQEAGGYGLGLAIAKKIVTGHHGSIGVESTPGKGATFNIRLPLKQPKHL